MHCTELTHQFNIHLHCCTVYNTCIPKLDSSAKLLCACNYCPKKSLIGVCVAEVAFFIRWTSKRFCREAAASNNHATLELNAYLTTPLHVVKCTSGGNQLACWQTFLLLLLRLPSQCLSTGLPTGPGWPCQARLSAQLMPCHHPALNTCGCTPRGRLPCMVQPWDCITFFAKSAKELGSSITARMWWSKSLRCSVLTLAITTLIINDVNLVTSYIWHITQMNQVT